jgi:hypothetical protein
MKTPLSEKLRDIPVTLVATAIAYQTTRETKSTFALPANHESRMVESYTLVPDGREIKKNMMTP